MWQMWYCIANTLSMRYRFHHVGADLRCLALQPDTRQPTLKDNGYGLMYHAMCLFIPPAFIC